MIRKVSTFLILFLLVCECAAYSKEFVWLKVPPNPQFEKMEFHLTLMGVKVGGIEMEYEKGLVLSNRNLSCVRVHSYTVSAVRKVYPMNNLEESWFTPDTFIPMFRVRNIQEAGVSDMIRYRYRRNGNIEITQSRRLPLRQISVKGISRDFYTLLYCLRAVDLGWYVSNSKPLVVHYYDGIHLETNMVFRVMRQTVKYQGKNETAFTLKLQNGDGRTFTLLEKMPRLPYSFTLPGMVLPVIGKTTLNGQIATYSSGRAQTNRKGLNLVSYGGDR